MREWLLLIGGTVVLAGCATAPAKVAVRPASVPASRVIAHRAIHVEPGLEGVVGVGRAALEAQFGPTRLDIRDGDAIRLQWSGSACILDAYLYPPESGSGAPITTYVDARRGDGRDVDKASCVAALKKR